MECPYKKDIFFFEYKNNFSIVHICSVKNVKRLNILYTYHTDDSYENLIVMMIARWAIDNNIDFMWAINRGNEFDNIFPKVFNKSIRYAAWSSNKKIFEILQKGLLDFRQTIKNSEPVPCNANGSSLTKAYWAFSAIRPIIGNPIVITMARKNNALATIASL